MISKQNILSWSLVIIVIITAITISTCSQKPEINSVQKKIDNPLPRPSWVSEEPLVYVGNWDDIPLFETRKGNNPIEKELNYYKDYTEETVKSLKDLGVTMAIIPFYKAFGLEAEKENIEQSKKLAALLKKEGIRVGVYIGSSFGYETFLAEDPSSADWMVPDFMGRPVIYADHSFRRLVYLQHPGYKAYIKRVLQIAINDLKVDLIHFDNPTTQGSRPVFYHPMAIENFRTFLMNKYSPEMLKKRFGFSNMSYVEPPKTDRPVSIISDPMAQEWMDFRCQQMADYYGEMEEYIRGLNPEVAVENNPHGLSGQNTMWDISIDFPRLLSHTDFFWTEGEATGISGDGVLISKIRTFKMARTLKNRVFTYTSDNKLVMAEAMAYNRQGMGMVGDLSAAKKLTEDQKNYIKFFHQNFDYYRNVENIADVAVLHSYASMANNSDKPYIDAFLFEQSLIQAKIPFDIIFDDQLKDLSKYKVLVLADQECLSDEKIELVRNYVNSGGGLVATGNTSLYTEWRQLKPESGLKDLFMFPELPEKAVKENQVGKGRFAYIPDVIPSIQKPPASTMSGRYWKLPVNHEELIKAVDWASGNNLSLDIKAPLSVTMELLENKSQNSLILHLINFDYEKSTVKDIPVKLKIPEGKKVNLVTVMTPDNRENEIIQFTQKEKELEFKVPLLTIYDMIVIKL